MGVSVKYRHVKSAPGSSATCQGERLPGSIAIVSADTHQGTYFIVFGAAFGSCTAMTPASTASLINLDAIERLAASMPKRSLTEALFKKSR